MDNLNIKEVPFSKMVRELNDTRYQIYNVSAFSMDMSTGEVVEETYIPASYKDITRGDKNRFRSSKKDPFLRLGEDNQYPFFLIDLVSKSPTHKKAYKSSANIAFGSGLVGIDEDGADFVNWLINEKGLTAKKQKEILKQIALFGGAYVNLDFVAQVNNGSKKFLLNEIEISRYQKMRIGKVEEDGKHMGERLYHWYHPEYNASRSIRKEYLKGIPIFKNMDQVSSGEFQLVQSDKKTPYFKNKPLANKNKYSYLIGDVSITSDVYPEASYESDAAFYAIYLEASLAAFDSAGLRNGLMAGYIVTVPLADTSRRDKDKYEEKKESLKRLVEDKLQGAENNQRMLVVFQDPKDKTEGIKISAIPHTNTSQMHNMMDERKRQNILSGWGVPDSRLIGLPPSTPTGFANQSEVMKTAEDVWYTMTIYPEIVTPFEDFINTVMKSIYKYERSIETTNAKAVLKRKRVFNEKPSDPILFNDFTRNERRVRYGYEPLNEEEEQQLQSEIEEMKSVETTPKVVPSTSNSEFDAKVEQLAYLLHELDKKIDRIEQKQLELENNE